MPAVTGLTPLDADRAPRRAIRKQLLISVAALVTAAGVLTLVGQSILSTAMTSVSAENQRTNAIADAVDGLELAVLRQQTLVLGHALTNDEATLERFEDASDAEFDAYLQLARVVPDGEVAAAASRVRARAAEWREQWAEPYLRTVDPADAGRGLDEGARLFTPIEAALADLNRLAEVRLAAAEQELSDVVGRMSVSLGVIMLAMSAFIALAGTWLIRSISRPLQKLNATAQALIAGDEVTFVPEADNEIGALAIVLEQLRLDAATRYAAARVEAETAATFNQLGELTSFAHSEEALVDAASRVLQRIAPSPRGTIMLLNNSTNRLTVAAAWGEGVAQVGSVADLERIDACPGIRRAMAYVAQDLSDALTIRCPAHPAETGTVACLPMAALGNTVGVIHAERSEPDSFDVDTVMRATRVAEQAALAIANARLMKSMESLANTDPLTGLRNPRFFDSHLEHALARVGRDRRHVGLIMLDADHFKQFNDTYGHPAGDEALRSLARTLRSVVRAGDIVARYGGEEFIVALEDASLADALEVAEKLRLAVEQTAFEIGPGRYGRITISLGVVATDAHAVDQKSLVALADAALYRAKEAGRNRVETAPNSTAELERAAKRRRADVDTSVTHPAEPIALPLSLGMRSSHGGTRVSRSGAE